MRDTEERKGGGESLHIATGQTRTSIKMTAEWAISEDEGKETCVHDGSHVSNGIQTGKHSSVSYISMLSI